MKNGAIALALAAVAVTGPVLAKPNAKGFEVVDRDARGRATKVSKDGKEYAVCTSDNSDGCINPREAGLGYGNNVARDWPGRPISRER